MKLKEIKPRMAIHCTEKVQIAYFVEHGMAKEWLLEKPPSIWVLVDHDQEVSGWMSEEYDGGKSGKKYCEREGYECVEFSDLIMPELTAEEAIRLCGTICGECETCGSCPFYREGNTCLCDIEQLAESAEEIIATLEEWKAAHEKKAPEIETVDICRIIEILPDGRKRCVHEEDIKPDPELPYGSEQLAAEEILKRYCMEHEGEFIAVHEVISRVKVVN